MRFAPLLLVFLCVACASAPIHERAQSPSLDLLGGPGAGRAIARWSSLEVERKDPTAGPPLAVALAKSHGGYAEQVSTQGARLRIPAERLDAFLGAVSALGEVSRRTVMAEDVTDARRDLQVRFDNLTRVRERYLELLQRAASVDDAVKVEKELERVTAEYESMKAQLESMDGRVTLASVNVEFSRPVQPGPVGWLFYGLVKGVKWLFVWD
ncbi:DUF4349 domain-containing protein [Corallococcus sp. M34]|uniref:DUF4349 domain-containing protein n=1 Tax=Citreicoccus inhibens TaxID=2849499 RepID=UPI0013159A7E|nr:DUF4349 domain-containing protein [Citreicoccus inhibens]MBU8897501.1 DUF4349 domain-containing protein [Citreicoccus inhibens]